MTKAIDEGEAVEKFISLMRELGRFPVRGELQIKARADKCFPSYKVFQRRWSKEQLAKKILSYCAERPGYEDVAPLCAPIAAQDVSPTEDTRTDAAVYSDATTKRGFVYLKVMKISRREKLYKIGNSVDVERRNAQISAKLSIDLG